MKNQIIIDKLLLNGKIIQLSQLLTFIKITKSDKRIVKLQIKLKKKYDFQKKFNQLDIMCSKNVTDSMLLVTPNFFLIINK